MAKKNEVKKNVEATVEEAKVTSKKSAKAKTEAKTAKADTTAKKTSTKKAAAKTAEKKPIEKSVKPVVKKAGAKPKAKTEAAKKTVVATKKANTEAKPKAAKYDRDAMFPVEIEFEGESYVRSELTSEELVSIYENGEVVLFAVEWPKEYIKQYEQQYAVKAPKGGFENGFDLAQLILVQEVNKRFVCASIITEALFFFEEKTFQKRDKDGVFKNLKAHIDCYLPKK